MKRKTAFTTSLLGTALVALCCFTPILVILLGAIGLSAWVGYLDYVLLPALGVMLGLTVLFYWRYRRDCKY